MAGLRYGCSPERPSKLAPSQKRRLGELLDAGPPAAGYPTGCWSARLIRDLILREFGRLYSLQYLSTFLRNLGFSYQKARFVSDHPDPERRRVWREETWPAIRAAAQRRGALLLFGGEASFAQWGSLAYTWARAGRQPPVPTCGKRKAYKVFGLIDYFTGRCFFNMGRRSASPLPATAPSSSRCSTRRRGRSSWCRMGRATTPPRIPSPASPPMPTA